MDESNASILIVDDKPDKLLALEALLQDLSPDIVCASGGREALRQVLKRDFAVILLDVNMPDMDGFETAELIRQRQSSAHIPIIFLTAMSDELHVARGYSLGAVDYILTPVVPAILRSKVTVFLELYRKTRQVELQADRLRQRAIQLHRLTAASLAINSAPSVARIVQTATETARDIIGAHQAIMFVAPGENPDDAVSYVSYSDKYAKWRDNRVANEQDTPVQTLMRAMNKPMRMSPMELETHIPLNNTDSATPALRGLLSAPVTGRDGRHMGTLLLSDKYDGEFSEDDQAVLMQLSQMAAVAVDNAILAEEREANRLKDEFLSTLSHELRTPLSAISGWVQLMKMDTAACDVAHGIRVIERNVTAQAKLIDDLLDLSRVTTGKLRLNVRPFQIAPVVEAALEAIRPVLADRKVNLEAHLESVDAGVSGDPDRLQQVFGNLLNNAAKFTPSGGTISVRLWRQEGSIHIVVSDTGEGIDPGFLPHVFDRFRQADSSSSRKHGGLGIGLTIVQQIVALHRGTVTAHSDGKGRGAKFAVILPVLVNGVAAEAAAKAPSMDEPAPSLSGLRILVVDDDMDCREVVKEMLQRCDARVMAEASVVEAIRQAEDFFPDLIITDLAMPNDDGFSMLRNVRRLRSERLKNIPVVALTAYTRPEDRAQALAAGFNECISKPPTPGGLGNLIRRLCNGSEAPRTAESSFASEAQRA